MSRASESSITFDPDESERSFDSDSESSFDPQRASESDVSLDERVPNSVSTGMLPPPAKSRSEMVLSRELNQLEKRAIITKYLELNATEENLRRYNRKIILENRALREETEIMREDIDKKDIQIEVLKMTKERSEKAEKVIDQLQRKNAVLIQRVADLTGKRVLQGGTRKRRK